MELLAGHSIRSRMGGIEAHLLAKLADEIVDSPSFTPTPTTDRWLLSSQLQKAIRRGHVPFATASGLRLLELDAPYLWRRLRVIAVEDIGLANLELASSIMALGGKRSLHRRLGEHRVLRHLIRRLCESLKNRTACELSCWIDFSDRTKTIRSELVALPPSRRADIASAGDGDVLTQAVAWQLLCGFTERTHGRFHVWSKFETDTVARFLLADRVDDLTAYLVMRSRDSEGLAPMLPLASAYCKERVVQSNLDVHADSACDTLHGSMAAAFCRHTRAGLAAFRWFLHRHPDFNRQLRQAGARSPHQALGWLVFQCESGVTDRTLDPPPARALRRHVEDVMLAHTGLKDTAAADDLRKTLCGLLPELNKARFDAAAAIQLDLWVESG